MPIRNGEEKSALIASVNNIEVVANIGRLISETAQPLSQFRFKIDEANLKVLVLRNGLGWGPNVTVASVAFKDEDDFQNFLQAQTFSSRVKELLVKSLLTQKGVLFRPSAGEIGTVHLRASNHFVL